MNVLIISKALVAKAYHKKLDELVNLGITLHLVVPTAWGPQKLEIIESPSYQIHPLNIFFNGKNHFHFYKGLSKTINKIKPDIIHIDEEHYSIVTFQAMRLAKKAGARTLFFTWQNIHKDYPFPFSWIEKYNFSNAGIAVAGNNEAKDILRKKGFKKDIHVIPQFGVDPDIYKKLPVIKQRENLNLRHDDFVIGYMGRLVEEKGILNLLDIMVNLRENARLLFVGSGNLKNELLRRAKKLGIENKVRIIDHVPSTAVPEYLNYLDCLVLPSLTKSNWKEQFGRILIEAMACEIPAIGSDSGEIPNVIGNAGLIFHEGDTDKLSSYIELLLNNPDIKKKLMQKGRERVLKYYTQEKIAVGTVNVYKQLMGNP